MTNPGNPEPHYNAVSRWGHVAADWPEIDTRAANSDQRENGPRDAQPPLGRRLYRLAVGNADATRQQELAGNDLPDAVSPGPVVRAPSLIELPFDLLDHTGKGLVVGVVSPESFQVGLDPGPPDRQRLGALGVQHGEVNQGPEVRWVGL